MDFVFTQIVWINFAGCPSEMLRKQKFQQHAFALVENYEEVDLNFEESTRD